MVGKLLIYSLKNIRLQVNRIPVFQYLVAETIERETWSLYSPN